MYEEILNMIIPLAISAGKKIMEVYNDESLFGNIEYKSDNSPLTLADRLSNDIIVAGLRKYYPDYAVLSEEERDNKERLNNDYCFVVDPLDGTKEFIKRNGQFTVNIALAYRHRAVVGVIYAPASDDLYYAAKACGAWYRHGEEQPEKMQVSDVVGTENIRMVMSSSHGCTQMDELIKRYNIVNFVKMGSSLKGCLVAKGEAEAYYRYNPTMEWDTAAMQCITEEAGAVFRQMDDTEMLYNRENSLNEKGFYIINNIKNKMEN